MKFFMTSEADALVGKDLSIICNNIEKELQSLGDSYGSEVMSISIIPIVVNLLPTHEAAGFFKERILFKRKQKDADIRLRIKFSSFLNSNDEERRLLVIKNVIDSIRALGKKATKDFDSLRLEQDILKRFEVSSDLIDSM